MSHRALAGIALSCCVALPLVASSSRSDDVKRVERAAQVLHEVVSTPEQGIPRELLERAQCVAVIPGEKKFALGFGGQYGKGVATCRTSGRAWSAPLFITVGGGSWGLQLGGASTDVVMIFTNRDGITSLMSDKFRIGADATAAGGPVGRSAAAGTDIALHSEILTYSRSRGAFAGVSLNGSVVQPDDSGNRAMYGNNVDRGAILNGRVRPPAAARPLLREVERFGTPDKS